MKTTLIIISILFFQLVNAKTTDSLVVKKEKIKLYTLFGASIFRNYYAKNNPEMRNISISPFIGFELYSTKFKYSIVATRNYWLTFAGGRNEYFFTGYTQHSFWVLLNTSKH